MKSSAPTISAAAYDAWYLSSRGRYIGETEFRLLWEALKPRPREQLLDIGCGTGYFTRRFAERMARQVVGIDCDLERLTLARSQTSANELYIQGDAQLLPFPDNSFDLSIAVTSLSFMTKPRQALVEMLRVTRRGFAVALLNRQSLLYQKKGRPGADGGGYQKACWHNSDDAHRLFKGLNVTDLRLTSAIFLPLNGPTTRLIDSIIPNRLLLGGFLLITGNKVSLPK